MNTNEIKNLSIKYNKENIAYWREYLKNGFDQLKSDFRSHPNTYNLFKQHCRLIDELLISVWKDSKVDTDCCLIAVGGYGRSELYPHSDIDILVLMQESESNNFDKEKSLNSQNIEALIGLLWDLGLSVGHSVRNLSECIEEASKDITVQTNLLESRFISGNVLLYENFLEGVNANLDTSAFFIAKLKEQDNRHAKFNDTAYNLEPNIKESPGGLRDLHMISWLTQIGRASCRERVLVAV